MLRLSNIAIHYGGNYLFRNVNVFFGKSDKVGLIGRNGTGKSTLLKIISKLETPESGDVIIPKDYKIGYLPQDFISNFTMTVFDEAKLAFNEIQTIQKHLEEINNEISKRTDYESKEYLSLIENFTILNDRLNYLDAGTMDAQIELILYGLGFTNEDFYKPAVELSGGWQMRLELAKLLLEKPNCILLDEPTNHLDIESIIWLENFLKNYNGTVLLVSHDRRFLDNITNRTVEISLGKIYDLPNKYSEFIKLREQQRELEEAAYRNQQKQIAQTERFIERFRYKNTLATRVQSRIKALDKIERIELEDMDKSTIKLHFPTPPRSSRLVVSINNLSKSYGENLVLNNIDLTIERGDRIAFVGKNGEGKSTLSKIIAGIEVYKGELEYGQNVDIAYFAQHQALLFDPKQSVFDVIDNAATGDMRSQIRHLLGAFLFSGDDVYKKVSVLSGGEKSRLALAKLLLKPTNFLILDEPTNHLDMSAKDVLKNAIMHYSGTLVVVSHDREFLEGLTDKVYEFKNKKVIEYLGDISYFLEKQNLDSFREYEKNPNNSKNRKNDLTQILSDSAQQRIEQKAYNREVNKLNKQIKLFEEEISQIELEIENLEKVFSEPDFYLNQQDSLNKQKLYENLKNQLIEKMEKWEEAQIELENLTVNK